MTTLDMTPGAQIPRQDAGPQTAATGALASAAYRDGNVQKCLAEDLAALRPDVGQKAPIFRMLSPSLGEAFTRAVLNRTLAKGRKPLGPSYGIDPRMVVEHCLEAQEIRSRRDRKLTVITLLTGLLFLPGTILWVLAFALRGTVGRGERSRQHELAGGAVFAVIGLLALLFLLRPPFGGLPGLYLRIMLLVPVLGWYLTRRVAVQSYAEMSSRWTALVDNTALGPQVPKAVPRDEKDTGAHELRLQLDTIASEQDTNVLHYAGPKGPVGVGRRWGSWVMDDQLRPRPGALDIRTFHPWDVVRKVTEALNGLRSSEIGGGGIPAFTVRQYVMKHIGEGADEIPALPSDPTVVDGHRMRDFEVQRVSNAQALGSGTRHYLGIQFVLSGGQLVVTLFTTVTVLANNLRVEVTAHALGPVNGLFTSKPARFEDAVPQRWNNMWKEQVTLRPTVHTDEVVRLALRAPFTWAPDLLDRLGGKVKLPEPFSLRAAWAVPPWADRFKADDAIRVANPVVHAVHRAVVAFLEEHDVDTKPFTSRSSVILTAEAQPAFPGKPDEYNAH